ncbi:MAG: GNAT family N-acetyltransferase [Trueperaceae bacterium]
MKVTTGSFDFDVVPTEVRHGPQSFDVLHLANGYPVNPEKRVRHARLIEQQLERFPEGQFVAVTHRGGREIVVGTATTLRTRRPPDAPPLCWHDVIGDYSLPNHDPEGAWLYGVEIAVHPEFQRRGIASALYTARLGLVPELGLEGWYAGGMLMGYHRYADVLSPRAYAERVLAGELSDPTVTMQLHRGLQPLAIVEDYYPEPKAGGCAVLIAWRPPRTAPAKGLGKPIPGLAVPGRLGASAPRPPAAANAVRSVVAVREPPPAASVSGDAIDDAAVVTATVPVDAAVPAGRRARATGARPGDAAKPPRPGARRR